MSASTEKVASPEYFIKALLSQICFQDLSSHFEENQVILELGLGGFSQLLKNTIGSPVEIVKFEDNSEENGVIRLLNVLGR